MTQSLIEHYHDRVPPPEINKKALKLPPSIKLPTLDRTSSRSNPRTSDMQKQK